MEPVSLAGRAIEIHRRVTVTYRDLARVLLRDYWRRSVVGFMPLATQSFLCNAIFFTYALVLAEFYGIGGGKVAYFTFPVLHRLAVRPGRAQRGHPDDPVVRDLLLRLGGGLVEFGWGVNAERRSLNLCGGRRPHPASLAVVSRAAGGGGWPPRSRLRGAWVPGLVAGAGGAASVGAC